MSEEDSKIFTYFILGAIAIIILLCHEQGKILAEAHENFYDEMCEKKEEVISIASDYDAMYYQILTSVEKIEDLALDLEGYSENFEDEDLIGMASDLSYEIIELRRLAEDIGCNSVNCYEDVFNEY
jgi:hypothetical protein